MESCVDQFVGGVFLAVVQVVRHGDEAHRRQTLGKRPGRSEAINIQEQPHVDEFILKNLRILFHDRFHQIPHR